MTLEFRLPAVAEPEAEGFVVNWFKDEGQPLRKGELLLEVQFEKVTTGIDAPQDGVLAKILTPQGEPVRVGQPLCLIADAAEAAGPAGGAGVGAAAAVPAGTPPSADASPAANASPSIARTDAPRATPAARRLARELGVDITQVTGSGPAGRISEEDVRRFAAERSAAGRAPLVGEAPPSGGTAAATGSASAAGGAVVATPATPAAPAPSAPPVVPGPSAAPIRATVTGSATAPSAGRREPLPPAQCVVGERMLASLRETAQFTLGREVEVTALVALRARLKQAASPITLNDLIHRAVVIALGRHAYMQAQLEGGGPRQGAHLRVPEGVDLGFAIARGRDLLVPVIRNAHTLDLPGLAAERLRLTEAVRSGTASALDLQGGTFTVTNLGGHGIDFFTPILNPPQPAILGVGRTVERLVMRGRAIEPAHFLTLSLTVDHRVINGADGAAFLAALADLLASPEGWALSG